MSQGRSRKMVEMGVSEHQGGQGLGGRDPHTAVAAGESDLTTEPTSAKHEPWVLEWHLDQGIWSLRE